MNEAGVDPRQIGALVALVNQNRPDEAERGARTLLATHPDAGMLWKILGVALMRQGKEALPALRRTAQLMPQDAESHGNLGAALHDRGQWAEAVASYRRALTLDSNYVEALNDLGNVLRDLGERREAASLYRRAIELDPGRTETHYNLGNILFEMRRIDEAAQSFHRALALQPGYAPAHLSLGMALRLQRRAADAQASCRAALAIDPDYAEALNFLGDLNADRGQFDAAEKLFRQALSVNPEFALAYCSIAAHRKMTEDDTAWLQGAEALLAKPLPLGQEVSLRYALGKYFDDIGHYDRAFGHYRQANELTKRYGSRYDGAKLTRRIDEIIESSRGWISGRGAAPASAAQSPVFIVGMPRSGTSLAEQILASHPALFGAGEVVFWDAAFSAFRRAHPDAEAGADPLAGMAAAYLDRLKTMSGGAPRVVDKMPANFLYAGLIHAVFPNARIIHMRRHPIDTCLSIYFQHFFNMGPYANDLSNLAHYYGEYVRLTDHWRAVLPAASFLEVPYEALIDDQEGWTRRMLDFVGLPWDPKCLEFHRTDRVVITASKWQVRQKIYAASTGRWKNYEKFLGPLRSLETLGQ